MATLDDIRARSDAFHERPFPRGYGGEEVDGICLVQLDAETSGCIEAALSPEGLDGERQRILHQCASELARVAIALDGEARSYFRELRDIAEVVLARVSNCRTTRTTSYLLDSLLISPGRMKTPVSHLPRP